MKIIIVGKSASGKTEFSLFLKEKGFKVAIFYTTRPKRSKEENMVHYYFINNELFLRKIQNNEFIEYNKFNDWLYGLSKEEFNNSDVIISTPSGLDAILNFYDRNNLIILYLDVQDSLRLERLTKRGDDKSEIKRRFDADNKDFHQFIQKKKWDICINQLNENSFKYFLNIISYKQKQTFLNLN